MARRLHLQRYACGHGGGAWVALPAPLYYSIIESSHCPPGIGRKFFGRAVSAAGTWANGMNRPGLTCSLVWQTIRAIMGDHSQEEQALIRGWKSDRSQLSIML